MIQLNGKESAPTFESPLDMLHACHDRIMDQCATLQKLMNYLPMNGCDVQAQQAAQAIMRYFDTAGKFHHQDEEENLFPLLLATQNADIKDLIEKLQEDHQAMDAAWLKLRSQLQQIAEGKLTALERNMVADFSLAYGRHVMLENTHLLPKSARLLTQQQLIEVGKKMAERRGVTLPQS